ncbi:uncharacterized protein LOC130426789 [Triplophysa dalaica]|uniref:uncharacterized protein LOC130426789 n=1 Tax=Triplophysa dalaica TaxID=1582913 RepID=UPI0024DFB038|nr:uncharacterized protein LOC130426789 [Triplophysa dalaica]
MVDKCALKSPPGLHIYSTENHKGGNKASTPQITLTPASPAVPQKAPPRSRSPTLMLCDSPLRSYSPGSDEQRLLYDDMPMQITFQISMRFPPPEACGTNIHQCQLPEVFLTVGQPGETVVLPLNPKPGRPVSFSINPPKKHHYRSASPHRSPARHERGRSSSPNRVNVTSPISPREDYFSLIQRVHTAQLQHNNGQERGDMNREPRRGKGKSGGRKEKKEGNRGKKK